ncbi:MAG: methyltransferase domain-containing protein [Hyphomicrobium sp.]
MEKTVSDAGAPSIIDRETLDRRIARIAANAGEYDYLLERVAGDFADRLGVVRRSFARAVCLGPTAERLAPRVAAVENVGDVAVVSTDEGALPLEQESLDLVVSALTLQVVNDIPGALAQIRRALKPDGLMLAALLGGETLKELREAWLVAEDEVSGGASPRVAPFADVRDLGTLLQRAGFALPVADAETVIVRYPSAIALMREIKAMGASNMLTARRRAPVTRRLLLRAAEVYANRFSDADGRVRATFEIVTLTGWAPHDSQQKPLRPGSAMSRLADALGVAELDAGEKAPRSK